MGNLWSYVRRIGGVVVLGLVPVALAGCGGAPAGADSGEADGGRAGCVIGVSQAALDTPFQQQLKADLAAAANRADVGLLFHSADGDSTRQQTQVRQLIRQGVDVIILGLDDPGLLTAPVSEAMAAKIPVVLLHRSVVGNQYTCLLRVDNRQIGTAAGGWIAGRSVRRGTLVELKGKFGSREADGRHTGYRATIRGHDFRSFFEAEMDWDQKKSQAAMEEALGRHARIAAVFAHNDRAARGAYLAAKQVGRQDEMVFVGVGALPGEGIALIKEGILDVSIEYPTGGAEAVDVAMKILGDEAVEKNVTLPLRIFTKENVQRGGEPVE